MGVVSADPRCSSIQVIRFEFHTQSSDFTGSIDLCRDYFQSSDVHFHSFCATFACVEDCSNADVCCLFFLFVFICWFALFGLGWLFSKNQDTVTYILQRQLGHQVGEWSCAQTCQRLHSTWANNNWLRPPSKIYFVSLSNMADDYLWLSNS